MTPGYVTGSYEPYLALGAVLFVLGAVGFTTRRNLILMMLSAELMLHGVSLTLLAFGQMHGGMDGQAFTVFVLTVAACEAGLSLSIILSLYQRSKSLDVELWSTLKEADVESGVSDDDLYPTEERVPLSFPTLTTAGGMPTLDDDAPLGPQQTPARKRKKGASFRYGEKKPPNKTDG